MLTVELEIFDAFSQEKILRVVFWPYRERLIKSYLSAEFFSLLKYYIVGNLSNNTQII